MASSVAGAVGLVIPSADADADAAAATADEDDDNDVEAEMDGGEIMEFEAVVEEVVLVLFEVVIDDEEVMPRLDELGG